jgi:hypothetical protein
VTWTKAWRKGALPKAAGLAAPKPPNYTVSSPEVRRRVTFLSAPFGLVGDEVSGAR